MVGIQGTSTNRLIYQPTHLTAERHISEMLPLPNAHRRAVTACTALANILKTSLGPVGLDKMLVRMRACRFKSE